MVGFGLLAGLAVAGYNVVSEYRESRKPVNRLRRRAGRVADDLGDRWSRTRERMPYRVSISTRREEESVDTTSQEPGMIKKILWAGLTAGTIALAGLLARRFSSTIWQMIMGEPPPTAKV